MPSSSFLRTSFPSVLESPRDLQFSDIRETSARVSWTPPTSRVDGFKVSYQLADGITSGFAAVCYTAQITRIISGEPHQGKHRENTYLCKFHLILFLFSNFIKSSNRYF